MQRIGLTGGIASGKSVVAEMLRGLGFHVIDADTLGHTLIEPGQSAYAEITREFGPGVTQPDGRIDRVKLGGIVFAETKRLERLNAIVHPRVEAEMLRQFVDWEQQGVRDAAFVEAALLVEAGYHKKLDGLVVAWCKPEQQVERLRARGLSDEEALRRIAAQMPVAEKLRLATAKIDCSGTMEETRKQVQNFAERLRQPAQRGV